MPDKTFSEGFLAGAFLGTTATVILIITFNLNEKIKRQRAKINELISLLNEFEKNNESSQDS